MTVTVADDVAATLDRVSAAVEGRAAALDTLSTDVRVDLAELGGAGLFDFGLDERLDDMVRVIEEVSTRSLAVGFSAWAHRMTLQYVHLGARAAARRAPRAAALRDAARGDGHGRRPKTRRRFGAGADHRRAR